MEESERSDLSEGRKRKIEALQRFAARLASQNKKETIDEVKLEEENDDEMVEKELKAIDQDKA